MEPIFGLIEGNALRSLEHFVGYLLTAMRRQTVHDNGMLFAIATTRSLT